ncbi:SRPBCC family protein [Halorussus lipolyticus]|uniref:SRPBCC family protein n=1 Tax=Halorussus lipolyticus TaxID=3034024 RepID=UPI0023E87FCB|nr:SRPBCC family protein [Halorussus sp. DT80]
MERVTVTRNIEASPEALKERIEDVEPFMRSAGFDEVEVEGDTIHLANAVGLFFEIELTLEIVEDDDAILAYEQRDGIFEEMTTRYTLREHDGQTTVRATTEFAIDVAYLGPAFDATVVTRQRRVELTKQFDYLESEL